MKAKVGITIFSNGNMDILKGSLQEDLWQDYCFYYKKAEAHRKKNSKKSLFLMKRYERAACLALFEFFTCVLSAWLSCPGQKTGIDFRTACRMILRQHDLDDEAADFSHLYNLLERYERSRQALLENLSNQALLDMQESIENYLDYVEAFTELHRFPGTADGTEGVMKQLMAHL